MRIISGFLKGKKLNFLKNITTRPLRDSVKENIFNILKHSNVANAEIEKSNILDLYSGVGSFGIECISRGAKKVIFFEKDINAVNILKNNLTHLSVFHKAKVFNGKIENLLKNINGKFNVFFLDPPFKDDYFLENLEIIKKKKFFNSEHIVIIHRESKKNDNFNDLIKILDTKKYGRSKIIFGCFN